jgi:hypothetical protein
MNLNQLFSKDKMGENFLIGLLVLFLVIGKPIPQPLNSYIDSPLGIVVLTIIAISLFTYSSVLGVVGLFVAYQIMRNTGTFAMGLYTPSEEKKWQPSSKDYNRPKDTLEEEVIRTMAPTVNPGIMSSTGDFAPSLDNTYDALTL